MSWGAGFDDPIALANGRKLLTPQDAATYITNLPKKESDLPEWQAAIEALIVVADRGGPTMFARVGVMRALNRHVERLFDPSRKERHWGRRKTRTRSMKQEAVEVAARVKDERWRHRSNWLASCITSNGRCRSVGRRIWRIRWLLEGPLHRRAHRDVQIDALRAGSAG